MPSEGAGDSGSTGDAGPSESPRVHLVIVTDPGPDPDDVKTILSSAIKHRGGQIRVHGVVCNGGHQAEQRARLAKALLKYLRCDDIPVAIGSSGKPYEPKPHEYAFPGVEHVQASELREGNDLLLELLQRAAPHSLTFLMISAMTDLANVMRDQPELVQQKVRHICVMGGLQRREAAAAPPDSDGGAASGDGGDDSGDSGGSGWEPDTAVNNGWDPESARLMYSFCLAHGVPMSVVSRNAVPNLPMSIAKDFATSEPKDPVMKYLVDAQASPASALAHLARLSPRPPPTARPRGGCAAIMLAPAPSPQPAPAPVAGAWADRALEADLRKRRQHAAALLEAMVLQHVLRRRRGHLRGAVVRRARRDGADTRLPERARQAV